MVLPLLICHLSFLIFVTRTNGSTLIPSISMKVKSNVLVITNTNVSLLEDIRVIRATQQHPFIFEYEIILPLYLK